METLFDENENCEACAVTQVPIDLETRFSQILCNEISEIFKVPFPYRYLVSNLLQSVLNNRGFDQLIRSYLHANLSVISDKLNQEFDIKEEPVYWYAPHAKLDNHINAIKAKMTVKDEK
jgi:hypothetical protein